jgi:NAD(P)-dependent dehydrogenase (short-subunit alcohol dehydrogenase family)
MLSKILDTTADRSIVLGYGSPGLALRRRLPGWPEDPPPMKGKTVLVTGAASGLGLASAIAFARLEARVLALGRNERRAEDAADGVIREVPTARVEPVACDLSSLAALRELTARIRAEEDRLDVLVLNAGVMPPERERSVDGVELCFATHVLASWVLIDELSDLLERSAPSRVIIVSSGGMYGQKLPVGDPQSDRDEYGPTKFYARTKRQQVVLAQQWGRRLRGTGVVVHSMHPGWVDTEGVQSSLATFRSVTRPILRSPAEGADTIVWLGAAPEPLESTGGFWHDRRERPTSFPLGPDDGDAAARRELWETCARLAGREGVEAP